MALGLQHKQSREDAFDFQGMGILRVLFRHIRMNSGIYHTWITIMHNQPRWRL